MPTKVKIKMPLHDERMFSLMEYVIHNKINGCETETDFLRAIGYTSISNVNLVRKGTQHFTITHMGNAIEAFGVDGNFFLDKKHKVMFKGSDRGLTAFAQLQEAVNRVRIELREK